MIGELVRDPKESLVYNLVNLSVWIICGHQPFLKANLTFSFIHITNGARSSFLLPFVLLPNHKPSPVSDKGIKWSVYFYLSLPPYVWLWYRMCGYNTLSIHQDIKWMPSLISDQDIKCLFPPFTLLCVKTECLDTIQLIHEVLAYISPYLMCSKWACG